MKMPKNTRMKKRASKKPTGGTERELAPPLCSQFVVFVDDMDGYVYGDWVSATRAVTHAFMNGANEVTIRKWPTANAV